MNVSSIKNKVTTAIQNNGIKVKIELFTGRKVNVYGVWTEDTREGIDDKNIQITKNTRSIIVPHMVTLPKVGDFLEVGAETFSIDKIEAYRVQDTVVATQLGVS